ncbi:MAG TPA: uroporphyrinogen decarboxylase family protein [Anaerolineae bacterium]|nr:uroporphyrinogen decarboxylase family protein [Anaerolineae bacterium]
MPAMTRRERLEAAIRGEETDRVPVALWRHFPGDDQDPAALAASTLAFQQQYDFDFVKVTPASSFAVRDWGVEDTWVGNQEGTRDYVRQPVHTAEQWRALPRLEPDQGALRAQLRCLERIHDALGEEVPFIQTIFNPLSQAKNLVGRDNLLAHIREDPEAVRCGLETITDTAVRFIQAARERGIAGIFLAVQHANYGLMSEREYQEFGVPFDGRLLEATAGLWLNVLHLHGQRVMFDLLSDYPVQVVNWHDRETPPSLHEGQQRVKGAVLGGLRQWDTMLRGTPRDVQAEAEDAIEQTGGRRFILGTGCVTPITAPWANLRAVREAVEMR